MFVESSRLLQNTLNTGSSLTATAKDRLSFLSKKSRYIGGGEYRTAEDGNPYSTPLSSLTKSGWMLDAVKSNENLPSPSPLAPALHNVAFLQLQQNIRKLRKAPWGSDAHKLEAVWDIYYTLREESIQLCKGLIQKSSNKERHALLDSIPPGSRTSDSDSNPKRVLAPRVKDQWLHAVCEFKGIQAGILENIRLSLLSTYRVYEPDAFERQRHAFLTDKILRKRMINKWRDAEVHHMKSGLVFWDQYRTRSLNFDQLKQDIQTIEMYLASTGSGKIEGPAVEEHEIAKKGDAILEFRNSGSEIHPILRFRVASNLMAEASPLFKQILSTPPAPKFPIPKVKGRHLHADVDVTPPTFHKCEDGMEVKVYQMPQLELNEHDALSILFHAAHMHNQQIPREMDFPLFIALAEASMRYQCTSPIEFQVEYQWLPYWRDVEGDEYRDGLLTISYAFGERRLFSAMSEAAILEAVDEADIDRREHWPQAVKDRIKAIRSAKLAQIEECCANTLKEYLKPPNISTERRSSVSSFALTSVPRCPRGSHLCDSTNLGWIMLVYNELQILPSMMGGGSFANSPARPKRSLKDLFDCLKLIPSAPQVHPGNCDPGCRLRNDINAIYNSISGLTLRDVSGKNGWALSRQASDEMCNTFSESFNSVPDIHFESPVGKETLSANETICLKILSNIAGVKDLNSFAMVDKGFYGVYKRNEATLLKNIMKAEKRTRAMSALDTTLLGFQDPFKRSNTPRPPLNARSGGGQDPIYLSSDGVSPVGVNNRFDAILSTSRIAGVAPMTLEEAHRILWPDEIARYEQTITAPIDNRQEKFSMGNGGKAEDKTLVEPDSKHLRHERDYVLGLGI